MATKYIKTAVKGDWTINDTVSLPAGEYVPIARIKVPAQQKNRFGTGFIVNGVDDRGTLKGNVKDASGNVIAGSLRLVVSDGNGLQRDFIREVRSSDFTAGVKQEERLPQAKQDSYLVLEYSADSADTMSKSQSDFNVPITIIAGN